MRRPRGFTLIETAIALVVVGLLLGAMFKGQELINVARARSLMGFGNEITAAALRATASWSISIPGSGMTVPELVAARPRRAGSVGAPGPARRRSPSLDFFGADNAGD